MTTETRIYLPEIIVCAAVKYKPKNSECKDNSDEILLACVTYNCEFLNKTKLQVEKALGTKLVKVENGFLTNKHKFLTQSQAIRIAVRNNQLRRFTSSKDPNLLYPEELY